MGIESAGVVCCLGALRRLFQLCGNFVGEIFLLLLYPFAQLVSDKAVDCGAGLFYQVPDPEFSFGILDVNLINQAVVGVEFFQFAFYDFSDDCRRLSRFFRLAFVHGPLAGEHIGRHALAVQELGIRGCYMHRDIFSELLIPAGKINHYADPVAMEIDCN